MIAQIKRKPGNSTTETYLVTGIGKRTIEIRTFSAIGYGKNGDRTGERHERYLASLRKQLFA